MTLRARLHPHWVGGRTGYVYSVIFDGKLIVDRSREPECDAARALLARGITGKLTMLDGKTGKPRTTIDIKKGCLAHGGGDRELSPLQKIPRERWQRGLQPWNGEGGSLITV